MGQQTGLFFCDLDNRSRMEGVRWCPKGFFYCSRSFLEHPRMLLVYTKRVQDQRLAKLKRLGVLTTDIRGTGRERWMRINWNVVLQMIDRWLSKCEIPLLPIGSCPLLPGGSAKKEEETYSVSSSNKKKEAVAADAADRTPGNPSVNTKSEVTLPPLNPILSCALTKPSQKTTPSPFDQESADFVRKLCVEQGWVIARTHKKWWADQVRKLRQSENGPTSQQIANALAGYAAAVAAGKTKFKITDCHQLRTKWHVLQNIAAKMPPPASPRAVDVARRTSIHYKWPKVTPADVAGFAQRCISFAEDLITRLDALKKKVEDRLKGPARTPEQKSRVTRDRTLLSAVAAARVHVGNPDSWTERYLLRVQTEVRKWKEWSGDLSMYHPSLTSGKTGFKKAVLATGVGEDTWDKLKEGLK